MRFLPVRHSLCRRLALPALLAVALTTGAGVNSFAAAPPQSKHEGGPVSAQLAPQRSTPPGPLGTKSGTVALDAAPTSTDVGTAAFVPGAEKVSLRPLVIAMDNDDFGLATWSSTLDRLGTPYDVLLARNEPLTADRLVRANGVGRYNAILLTNNSLLYQDENGNYLSAFDAAEWNTLWDYERNYDIRQVSLYTAYGTFPEDYCLRPGSEGGVGDTPITADMTSAGASVFDYLRTDVAVPISLSYVYYSTLADGCAADPILGTGGQVLGVLSPSTDGRERAALTFTSNQYLPQTYLLTYGLFRWATKGVMIGERRHYLEVDVDDWFNYTDHLYPDGTLETDPGFRMSGSDAYSASLQQKALRADYPLAGQFTLNVPYNGDGIDPAARARCSSTGTPDPLTSYSRCLRGQFRWINHTYTHPKMNFSPYAENRYEIEQNLKAGKNAGLSTPRTVLKTPEYSGLGVYHPDPTNDLDPPTDYGLAASNPEMLSAAKDAGVKYLHGNMSFGSHLPSCFNCAVRHPLEPNLVIVPDWPTNIAYHVTAPAEETLFYNSFYGPGGKFPYWDHDLTYSEIINWESELGLQHVMSGSVYSHTMHQGNLRQYASGKSLTFDWVNAVAGKYSVYYQVPLLTPTWTNLAGYAVQRSTHFAALGAGADVVWDRAASTLSVTSPVKGGLFLTGVQTGSHTSYGSDSISWVTFDANKPKSFAPAFRTNQ